MSGGHFGHHGSKQLAWASFLEHEFSIDLSPFHTCLYVVYKSFCAWNMISLCICANLKNVYKRLFAFWMKTSGREILVVSYKTVQLCPSGPKILKTF